MHTNRIYTGIGSRETPSEVLHLMKQIGCMMAQYDWVLRSGHAPGADQAFEYGALVAQAGTRLPAKMEIYLPWRGFEGAPASSSYITPSEHCVDTYPEALRVAAGFHPAWGRCTDGAKKLHTRNVYQVSGRDLNSKSELIICWTKDGARSGGTGQALRIASYLDIPIFDLAVCTPEDILEYVNNGVIPS